MNQECHNYYVPRNRILAYLTPAESKMLQAYRRSKIKRSAKKVRRK